MKQTYNVLIVGSGPIGIACAVECGKRNLTSLIVEKGTLCDALYRLPNNSKFFSTTELLEIDSIPFLDRGHKPTRSELLSYYKRVAELHKLSLHLHERVNHIIKNNDLFTIQTDKNTHTAKKVIIATGFYDCPNTLNIEGEQLNGVSHYYREPHNYYRKKVLIVGGANSAVEAALECYRYGVQVTLVHRHNELHRRIKYWVKPDIANRLKEGTIKAYFNTIASKITANPKTDEHNLTCHLELTSTNDEGQKTKQTTLFTCHNVLLLTGYHADLDFLKLAGVDINEDAGYLPIYNEKTMETNQSGLYLAGVVAGGVKRAGDIFVENGREHAKHIVKHILAL